jgi:hypothetical protein
MNTSQIQVTQDDILVRPVFGPDGTLEGYFAAHATDFTNGEVRAFSGEIRARPQEAVEAFAANKWPELGAFALGRRWIASRSRPGGYTESDFEDLVAAIGVAFPDLLPDRDYRIARQCELDWSGQQRQSRRA